MPARENTDEALTPSPIIAELKELVPAVSKQLGVSSFVGEVCCVALDEITVAVVIVDGKGKIYIVNKAAEVLFGYDRKELRDVDVSVLVSNSLREKHVVLTNDFFSDPKIVMHQRAMAPEKELFGQRKDGTLFAVTVDVSPFTTSEGLFVAATVKLK